MIAVDHTSFTAIWSQPVTALQIKDWDGQWRYVRHVDNALVSSPGRAFPATLLTSSSGRKLWRHDGVPVRWLLQIRRSSCHQASS